VYERCGDSLHSGVVKSVFQVPPTSFFMLKLYQNWGSAQALQEKLTWLCRTPNQLGRGQARFPDAHLLSAYGASFRCHRRSTSAPLAPRRTSMHYFWSSSTGLEYFLRRAPTPLCNLMKVKYNCSTKDVPHFTTYQYSAFAHSLHRNESSNLRL